MSDKTCTVAIIGGGPRGLAALEYLYEELLNSTLLITVKTVLFEPTQFAGSGPVYAPDQSVGNWLNIPERLVSIESRPDLPCESGEIRGFPSYQDWTQRGQCQ